MNDIIANLVDCQLTCSVVGVVVSRRGAKSADKDVRWSRVVGVAEEEETEVKTEVKTEVESEVAVEEETEVESEVEVEAEVDIDEADEEMLRKEEAYIRV